MRKRVRGFEGAEDAFAFGQCPERGQRLGVGCADILRATAVLEMGMLGPDSGVIEAGGDRPGVCDLTVLVLQYVSLGAVKDARRAAQQGRAMLCAVQSLPAGFDPDQPDVDRR